MQYSTTIDTVGIQIDFNSTHEQRFILKNLIGYLISIKSVYITFKDYPIGKNSSLTRREHYVYNNSTIIATINTGIFKTVYFNRYINKYYISIKFAGLKRYNEILDKSSSDCLLSLCAYLNTNDIVFKLTELDICIDVECKFQNILAICTKKSPKTHYYHLNESQVYNSTTYIEKIASDKVDKAVLRSYYYDKSHKEELDFDVTRFELKLQPKYFNKYGFSTLSIQKALSRYFVMYFEDIREKNYKIESYNKYKVVRKREIKKLDFKTYRLYPDMDYIDEFIDLILSVQNSDINFDTIHTRY